jgi:hypothetical protein
MVCPAPFIKRLIMKTIEIRKRLYDYGVAVGYAVCEEMEMCGLTKDEFKAKGWRSGYLEGDGLVDAIFPDEDEWSEENEDMMWNCVDEMYRGVNAACRKWWGVRSVSSGSCCYDLTISCN